MIGDISATASSARSAQVNITSSQRQANRGELAAPGGETPTDQVDISPQGSLMELLFGGLSGMRGGNIDLGDLRDSYREEAASFQGSTLAMFKQYGIDSSQEAVLTSDFEGKIRVANDHPDKEKVEAAFEDNPELTNQFRRLSAMGSLLRAADEAAPFQEAYANDPYGAVERYGYLFDDNRQSEFHLSISDAGIDEFFEER